MKEEAGVIIGVLLEAKAAVTEVKYPCRVESLYANCLLSDDTLYPVSEYGNALGLGAAHQKLG